MRGAVLGDWSRRLPPLPGELLTSCLVRNAHAHGSSPYRFFALFWPGDPVWNRDFDRDPRALDRGGQRRADWVTDIASKLRLPVEAVEAASLRSLRELLAGEQVETPGDTPLLLSAGIYHRTRLRHALQFCPDCLAEGVPHYRRSWRLGFVVACEAHGDRPLRDACPHCDAPVMPHRSLSLCLTDCHACGRPLTVRRAEDGGRRPPQSVLSLQRALLSRIDDGTGSPVGPWADRAAFDGVRALIAVSALRIVQAALRHALGLLLLAAAPAGQERLRFEQVRAGARVACLETAAAWLADWPHTFRAGARGAGLTQRSFARQRYLPGALADEVARLPEGVQRDRTWVPVLEEPVLRRLRRRDPAAYRSLRARRVLAAVGRA